jgi:alpha-glucosidase
MHDAAPRPAPARRPARPRWWQRMVLYESHLPSLRDGNGDGIGDIEGLIGSLDHLTDLGADAVWVGPFFRSPLLDQGFDITDHCDVEPLFGDLATVDRLIEEAHRRGIRVILDYVPNHTSDQHPWFVESRSSRDNPKRDWYLWTETPNNWTSEAGGSVWEHDERTGQYYLHSHLKEQPDLNWRNPEVRAAMLDVLRFWLDRGVDGFRIDVAHMLMKDPELRDNPPNPGGASNPYDIQHPDFASQLHVHDRMHPDLHGVLREIRAVLDSYAGDRVAIGEIEAMNWERWAAYFGAELDELQLPFPFRLIETPWRADELAEAIAGMEAALPDGAWPILALGNHDRPRLATRLGRPQARVAAVLLLTVRGTPTILYADELGMVDQEVPPDRQRDHFGLTAGGVSRDPTRTPMPWDANRNAGFSTAPEQALWLPIAREHATVNVAAQRADADSFLNLYRRLLALRADSPALRDGGYATLPVADGGCLRYTRAAAGERMHVALNLTDTPCRLALDEPGRVRVATRPEREGEPVAGMLELGGDEAVVIE